MDSRRYGQQEGVAEPQDVGMLHGASDNKALIVSGCTSVHPYKYDVFLCFATPSGFLCKAERLRRLLTCDNSNGSNYEKNLK